MPFLLLCCLRLSVCANFGVARVYVCCLCFKCVIEIVAGFLFVMLCVCRVVSVFSLCLFVCICVLRYVIEVCVCVCLLCCLCLSVRACLFS